jgi:transglutaminase-like putative cysteine protease
MARTLVAYVLPAGLIALAWLRLEEPRAAGAGALWVVLLALAPALLPTFRLRLLAAPWVALVAAWVAFGDATADGQERRGFFGPFADRLGDGFLGYYDVRVPFAGPEQPQMHGVLIVAIFGFCLALAFAIASRRPLPAVLVLLAGAGWPATLLPSESLVYGALILVGALALLAALRLTRPTPALAAGGLVVIAALAVSSSAAVAKDGVLAWERWDPYNRPDRPVVVDYVWDANYDGIDFPKEKTTVLRIRGPERSLYWRATTLDTFTDDRWIENLSLQTVEVATGSLPDNPLLPAGARKPDALVTQEVQVVGLADEHLVAASTPVGIDGPTLGRVFKLNGGIVRLQRSLRRGEEYTVSSYAPHPKPSELALLGSRYPDELGPYLQIDRTQVAPFGAPGRRVTVSNLFGDERYLGLWPYQGLYRQAERLAAGARSPYGAVVAIEAWLRTTGGFSYDEQPPASGGLPALAYFVDRGRRGYCQQFAGAMALMLRFLGIPARVAAGFTSGDYHQGVWTVTDHNAHTWVEVWFPRYGWLAFDPTPGRGTLAGDYSASSTGFNARDAAEAAFSRARGAGGPDPGGASELDRLDALRERQARRGRVSAPGGRSTVWILLALVVAVGGAIGLAKLLWRRSQYVTRDPRRLAAAARRELAGFLADQGLDVSASATPEELHELVRAQLGVDGRPFARALAEARFGPPEGTQAAALRARRELRALLRVIRRSLSRAQRVRGFVTLRSLRA